MSRISLIVFSCILFSGCTRSSSSTSVSFYYWRTSFQLTPAEQETLALNEVTKLYVRYFDVALKDGKPIPVSPITFKDSPGKATVVPVIYIKNEVMLHLALEAEDLAKKIVTYIDQINTRYAILCTEIQIDCDWTLTSKETYFNFLERLKKVSNRKLSATIRLHQVKFHMNTGIPPVDRGVLMYYNMGRISADSLNSIYDPMIAKRYTGALKNYPLTLDIALPVFTWGMHIRNNKVIALLNKVDNAAFTNDIHFEMRAPSFFEVKENVIKIGRYFEKGDRIKIESITPDELEGMAEDLSGYLREKPQEVIFYDLDNFNLKHYPNEKQFFQKVSRYF
ncbi:hypothetical protein SAMN05660236_2502 [Ohtaekwangia koreensis]|uniref:Lipoprotein n=1 Tax=Ohtaekwangia koreensis TaxID=688867 RepID=A0A1T5KQY0_9BACT|nr:hypothetical protein SAMN05660236_2502 [Ohtaekwangia koreensis]